MAATPENSKKKLHRLEDQLQSVNKDIKEYKKIFDEFGQEDKRNCDCRYFKYSIWKYL